MPKVEMPAVKTLEELTDEELVEKIQETLRLQHGTGKKPLSAWCIFSTLVSAPYSH